MPLQKFGKMFSSYVGLAPNRFHPLVWINGKPRIGKNVYIGGFSVVNAKGARVVIGDNCDIASFVSINCADSHRKCVGLSNAISRQGITLGERVFVGSHCVIKGGAQIGHHSVVAAGTIVDAEKIPPYSLVTGNPMRIKPGYYLRKRALEGANKTVRRSGSKVRSLKKRTTVSSGAKSV